MTWTLPSPHQRVIHLDIDGAEIGKVFPTEVGLVGDAKLGLQALIDAVRERIVDEEPSNERMSFIHNQRKDWMATSMADLNSSALPIKPQRVIAELNRLTTPEDIIVCDASYASGWGLIYYQLQEAGRTIIAPRGSAGLGFGLPAAEALACGTPVIATSAGALPEIVEDGVSGMIVPPGDAPALAKAVRTLIQAPDRCREMGEAGARRIRERFSWRRTAEETLALYEEVVERHRSEGGATQQKAQPLVS